MLDRVRRRTLGLVSPAKRKATEVLYEKMIFYDTKAKTHLAKMIEALSSTTSKSRGELAVYAYKQLKIADEVAIDCATKLAPYQAPKLANVELKSKVEHKFVIRAPQAPKSKEEWMKTVGVEVLEKQIDREISKVIKERALTHPGNTLAATLNDDDVTTIKNIMSEDDEEIDETILEDQKRMLQ